MRRAHALALLLAVLAPATARAEDKCVRIYYDRAPQTQGYSFGRIHAQMLQNLLGHFPNLQQIVAPIETYRAGDLETCATTFYLATFYNNPGLPAAFAADYAATSRNVVWAGYNVWSLGATTLDRLWRVRFRSLSTLDSVHLDEGGQPSFYRYYEYKGEEFKKYGGFDRTNPAVYLAAAEIAMFDFDPVTVQPYVIAWARHSATGDRQPYLLRNGNHWYVGDSPFSYITEADRYLIFADALFDMLDEPPRYATGRKPALLRVEDVHPVVPLWELTAISKMLEGKHVPYGISLFPVFTDPLGVTSGPADRFVALTSRPLFTAWARGAVDGGASIIYHGFTHQYETKENPFNAVSGSDFEFWSLPENRPVAKDSVAWVLGRLEDGLELLEAAGLSPVAWMTPHYQASVLDYRLFGQLFTWNVGRVIYFPFATIGGPGLGRDLRMDIAGSGGRAARRAALSGTTGVAPAGLKPNGQFFPYEIFGDAYDQRLVPEDVGNIQAYMTEQVFKVNTVDDLIRSMHRNRVLRDVWASLFVHPFCVEIGWHQGIGQFNGDTAGIARLVDAAREDGYEFIDLKNWVRQQGDLMRKPPIEIVLPGDPQPRTEAPP